MTIRRITSAFLIVVFALSITPVIFLHKIAANHTDISYANKHIKCRQLSKAGIHCQCINFVAEAPFLNDLAVVSFSKVQSFIPIHFSYKELFLSQNKYYEELRGPPLSV
ncbi:MAG: hypothetical protein JSS85_09015 [Bacteroidetes bacterium]|nr:hypothetical protein [Bacteroidota bacterium]